MSSKTRTLVLTGGLVVVIVIVALLALNTVYSKATAKTVTSTATVETGTVQSTVTATGNVSPSTSLALNFQSSGVVTEVDVKTGDQVVAGQTLAKIDDTQTQAALNSAQSALASAQANLANVEQPVTPQIGAENATALQSAQQQVATAQANVTDAQQNAEVNAIGYQDAVNQAQAQLSRDVTQYDADQASCATPTTSGTGSGGGSCAATLLQDQSTIAKDDAAITNAQQAEASGQLKDQQSIQSAQNSLNSAEDSLASTEAANNAKAAATPSSVAAAQSPVTEAQANLVTAQKNEEDTVLTAPSNGTVAEVNGGVGETVTGGGASSASSASAAGGTGASSSGASSAFITLDDITSLQVVAGFAEVDAAKIQTGQQATVTLNALPNQTISGQVTEVDINSTVVSNVVTYNVTITLTNPPTGAKPGMTANVSVVVGEADNVLELPTADITTRGTTSTVMLLRSGKQIAQAVTTGLVGDETTQITSGVTQGETVVTPAVSITTGGSTASTTRTGAGGFFGGGGGGGGGLGGAG